MQAKRPADSHTVMTEIVLPSDSNALGSAFGGKVTQWIDVCGAVAAQRHCRKTVVTASMDELHFRAPIRMGHVACLEARVNAAFSRSLEVEVVVHSEDPKTGERRLCCDAFLTFAALDDDFRPTSVPPLLSETEDEKARAAEAAERRARRLESRPQ